MTSLTAEKLVDPKAKPKLSVKQGRHGKISESSSGIILPIISTLCFIGYAYLFCKSIAPYWFNPGWTTDDALQQVYPFHEVQHPGRFSGDIITQVMTGYLTPIHYWLSYGITYLTGDPMMMAHWMMLLQIVLAVGFMMAAVNTRAGWVAACFAGIWLLHTRHIMQRLTSGLVRGWAAPLMTAYLYFVLAGNHWGVMATLLVGCALHPPATLVLGLSYGTILLYRSVFGRAIPENREKLRSFILAAPLLATVTLLVIQRPPEIGQMVSYEEAAKMPEFSRPYGRFPFVPLNPADDEIRVVGLQAFTSDRFQRPDKFWRESMPYWVLGSLGLITLAAAFRGKSGVPFEVWTFGIAALIVYFASREFAFKLYVPNRHLQFPLGIFFITAFSIGAWTAFQRSSAPKDTRIKKAWSSSVALLTLASLIYVGSNDGLFGAANFNYTPTKHGTVFRWLKQNTPGDALIAGDPTLLDGVHLFAARKGYATTETSHPFYPKFYSEIKRRTEIVLRAEYSKSLQEFQALLEPEKIDYFVFKKSDFYPESLQNASFFPPLDVLVKELAKGDPEDFAYKKLPQEINPVTPFRDKIAVVVDMKALKNYLASLKPVVAPKPKGSK